MESSLSMQKGFLLTIIMAAGVVLAGIMPELVSGQNGVSLPPVRDVVTEEFFNSLVAEVGPSCEAKGFYTRHAFLEAVESYPEFGQVGSEDVAKREIAAAFAHFTHETIRFCYINEINGTIRDYCDESNTEWPCAENKQYYGRGPIQLSWNFNYGPAGKSIGFDGLNNPDLVAQNPVIAFRTGLWYWMEFCHTLITSGQGFGATIRAINGQIECDGGAPQAVTSRVEFYLQYCNQFGVSPGDDLRC